MRIRGLQKKLYLFTYDKPAVNRKVLQIRCSLKELQKMLEKRPGKNQKKK